MISRSPNEISHLGPRQVRPFESSAEDAQDVYDNLHKFGIGFDQRDVNRMFEAYRDGRLMLNSQGNGHGMDADLVSPLLTPSITTPIQFLQAWLPGFVFILTKARKIDELIGVTTQGRWEDEEVVQGILERTGSPTVYGDVTNVPTSSWVTNFETRTIVRFEEGLAVGRLEEARAAAMRVSSAESKRSAAAEALEIERNAVGFSGYNGGANRTYGLLNDPNLPAYVAVPVGASAATEWATKTFLEITKDIRTWYAALRTQSGGRIDPGNEPVTMGIALSVYDFLSVTSDFGNSVLGWLKDTYPNTRVIAVPEFDAANGGENVAYLYAEGVVDDSTDDGRSIIQVVPSKFQTLGVEQQAKRYVEDFSNATSGVFVKRPYAIYRASDI